MALIKKLRLAKKNANPGEKPAVVKTHLRDMIIVPEMIGSVIGVYSKFLLVRLHVRLSTHSPPLSLLSDGKVFSECPCPTILLVTQA